MSGHRGAAAPGVRRLAGGLALAVALGLAGCGVPSGSSVVVEGRGPEAAPAFSDDGTNEPPGRVAAGNSPTDLIQNLLAAAAGDPKKAVARIREFLRPEVRADWAPDDEERVQVIHLHEEPQLGGGSSDDFTVGVTATVLGHLTGSGMFEPQAPRTATYTFSVTTAEREEGLFVKDVPPLLLLSDQALEKYYEPRTIYFWSTDHRVLVPDRRYLPRRDVPAVQRPTWIIDRLTQGPSPWLVPAVERLPAGAARVGNVPASADRVLRVVMQKAVANIGDREQVSRLATQLRWSLRDGSDDPVLDLRIDSLPGTFEGAGYLQANPAYRAGAQPQRFCLVGGQVRQLVAGSATEAGPGPTVPAAANSRVIRAALAVVDEQNLVALVRRLPDGRTVLDVGGGRGDVSALERITLHPSDQQAVSQPVWWPGSTDTGFLVVDGRLWSFRATGGPLVAVPEAPRGVVAFAVPPDGRRIAFIADGRLFVAPLLSGANRKPRVGQRVPIPTTMTSLQGVGWSQQDWLVVAGRTLKGQYGVEDITVDGAIQGGLRGQALSLPVNDLVASTDDPSDTPGNGQVMYMSNNLVYELFNQPRYLTSQELAGGANPAPGGKSPSLTNPFYLG